MSAGFFSIDIDSGIHIDSLKIKIDPFLFLKIIQREIFPVPANAGFPIATATARFFLFIRFIIVAPVMGQIQLPEAALIRFPLRK